jgi:hypothetical protein
MIRAISSLLLALTLALTSQSMAVARGASAATGQMVLCTGTGPMAVYVDAKKQPTSAPHICPECALNVLFALVRTDLRAPTRIVAFAPASIITTPVVLSVRVDVPPSRGPPVYL